MFKIHIRTKDVVKVGVQSEEQMEDVENSSCRLLPPLLALLSEYDVSVSRLLPIS